MEPIDLRQGSSAWHQYRLAKCTGSRVKDALSFLKNGEPSAKRKAYMIELVCERLSGVAAEHYVTPAMEWGAANESVARSVYESRTGNEVDIVGISQHPTIEGFMASCDGYVGEDGVVEFKAPQTATHVGYMLDNVIPEEHALQMYSELACSGRAWCDFVSWDMRATSRHELFVKRLWRDEKIIGMIEDGVRKFLAEVDEMIAALDERNPPLPEAPAEDYGSEGITDEDLAYLLYPAVPA